MMEGQSLEGPAESDEYASAVHALLAWPKFGNGMGLHRMAWMLQRIESERGQTEALQAIKITGTNGKGSLAAMMTAILQEFGVPQGLYISPHLQKFNERISCNGQQISDAEVLQAWRWFQAQQAAYLAQFPGDTAGAFEVFTCLALHHFASQRLRHLVLEVGIGGRYDPVRVVPGQVNALVSLDFDHTYLLGDTLEQIAYNKADLCDPGSVLVCGVLPEDVLRRLRVYCALRQVRVLALQELWQAAPIRYENGMMVADLLVDGVALPQLEMSLCGPHQLHNAALAVLLAREWRARFASSMSDADFCAALRRAFARVIWPGRFERVASAPDVYVDVGHSPAATAALVATAREVLAGQKILLVAGVSFDKNAEEILAQAIAIADHVICTRAWHRGAKVEDMLAIVRRCAPDLPCEASPTIAEAVARALLVAREQNMVVLVAGGLFLSIEAKQVLQGGDARSLQFF